ncbi:MAG TPA: hypothetical protein VEZ44_16160, partial [bacterium]|nr:hypothetical protein [bacterium]
MATPQDECLGAAPEVQGRWRYSVNIVPTDNTPTRYDWHVERVRADVRVGVGEFVGHGTELTCE